jgi:hypothetical protein
MTYIPQYQKEIWVEHAAALGMSQSEFVRSMVQAGRRDFPVESLVNLPSESADSTREDVDLQERVTALLEEAEVMDWNELLAEVRGDIETELETALASLQSKNQIRYDGRQGGYVSINDE